MKGLAVVAGVVFLLLGLAGFAGIVAMAPMHATVLAVAGVLFALYGATRRRSIVIDRAPGNDMRDFGM
jgi:hypothetical protein